MCQRTFQISFEAMASFRSDIVTKDLILKALKRHEKGQIVELVSFQVENGTEKGENFLGDLASVQIMAKVSSNDNQIQFKSYLWIIKMLKPDSGAFNLGRLLGIFDSEMKVYMVKEYALCFNIKYQNCYRSCYP